MEADFWKKNPTGFFRTFSIWTNIFADFIMWKNITVEIYFFASKIMLSSQKERNEENWSLMQKNSFFEQVSRSAGGEGRKIVTDLANKMREVSAPISWNFANEWVFTFSQMCKINRKMIYHVEQPKITTSSKTSFLLFI